MAHWGWIGWAGVRLCALMAGVSAVVAGINGVWFRGPERARPGRGPQARVSILVPARNEAANIEDCVRSLLAQTYPAALTEVLVLDDDSTDGTREILDRLAAEYGGRLRVLRSEAPLPTGWFGKPWACQQLIAAAQDDAEYFLLTDADTLHAPHTLAAALHHAYHHSLQLLSLMPAQEMQGWAEQAVVSLLPLQILGYLPLPLLAWLPHPQCAVANGQFMLFQAPFLRTTLRGYHHAAQSGADDVVLARATKAAGGRLALLNGAGLVRCRMYRTPAEVRAGFVKSFTSGFQLDGPMVILILLWNLGAYLLPFLLFPIGMARAAPWRWVAGATCVLGLAARGLLGWQSGMSPRVLLWHPLGMLGLVAIQCQAIWNAVVRKQTNWKGRTYNISK